MMHEFNQSGGYFSIAFIFNVRQPHILTREFRQLVSGYCHISAAQDKSNEAGRIAVVLVPGRPKILNSDRVPFIEQESTDCLIDATIDLRHDYSPLNCLSTSSGASS